MTAVGHYQCYEFHNIPIYVDPEKPDWFVPTKAAHHILRLLQGGETPAAIAAKYHDQRGNDICDTHYRIQNLLARIDSGGSDPYRGRSHYHCLRRLKECWFHLTNQCNMACSHCLFSCGTGAQPALPFSSVIATIEEAVSLQPDFAGVVGQATGTRR